VDREPRVGVAAALLPTLDSSTNTVATRGFPKSQATATSNSRRPRPCRGEVPQGPKGFVGRVRQIGVAAFFVPERDEKTMREPGCLVFGADVRTNSNPGSRQSCPSRAPKSVDDLVDCAALLFRP